MNGLTNALGPILVIVATLAVYVIVVQIMNDPACAAFDRSTTPILGKWLIEFLALCWL